MSFSANLVFVCCITMSLGKIIHSSGPTHRNYVVSCMEQISEYAFNFTKSKGVYYSQFLLTYIISRNMTGTARLIQEELLSKLHREHRWSIEVLQKEMTQFSSFSENCSANKQSSACVRTHVMRLRTQLYVMIVQEPGVFNLKIKRLRDSDSFDDDALIVVYYVRRDGEYRAKEFIETCYKLAIRNIMVMFPKNLREFEVYSLSMKGRKNIQCYEVADVKKTCSCIKGKINTERSDEAKNIFIDQNVNRFLNCYFNVHALPYEPFVINEESGIEIEIIKEIGKALNIDFRIRIFADAILELGKKLNGSWTGFVKPISEGQDIGIGILSPQEQFTEQFEYTYFHYFVQIVFVVPIAAKIPRWRVLFVIFSTTIWGICLATILGFAVMLYMSKTKKEVIAFTTIEKCITSSYRVCIGQAVPHHPLGNYTRVCFLGLTLLAIIINSLYTSSLINFLQNPVREYQISTPAEIVNYGLRLGASPIYKTMLQDEPVDSKLLESYVTTNESDSYLYWLKKVANERNISTFAIKLCVKYLLSKRSPLVVNEHAEPKVHFFTKPIRSQPIGIMVKKGNFLLSVINPVIQRLIVEGGLMEKLKQQYTRGSFATENKDGEIFQDEDNDDTGENEDIVNQGFAAISIHHLEGAFAIFSIGSGFGCLAFILELSYFYIIKFFDKKKN